MRSMEVLEEESFEYAGEVAHCGGGGSSGEVSYPLYMMEQHHVWLNTMNDLIRTIWNANPHNPSHVFDPSNIISEMNTNADRLSIPVAALDIKFVVWK